MPRVVDQELGSGCALSEEQHEALEASVMLSPAEHLSFYS